MLYLTGHRVMKIYILQNTTDDLPKRIEVSNQPIGEYVMPKTE